MGHDGIFESVGLNGALERVLNHSKPIKCLFNTIRYIGHRAQYLRWRNK